MNWIPRPCRPTFTFPANYDGGPYRLINVAGRKSGLRVEPNLTPFDENRKCHGVLKHGWLFGFRSESFFVSKSHPYHYELNPAAPTCHLQRWPARPTVLAFLLFKPLSRLKFKKKNVYMFYIVRFIVLCVASSFSFSVALVKSRDPPLRGTE